MEKVRIAVFVSGGGTNLEALLNAQERGEIPHGEIVLVVSSAAGAYALTRAERHGVHAVTVERKGRAPQDFEAELLRCLLEAKIDVIVLAGFLTILSEEFVKLWPGRILNVHPSLIPSFCGTGYYGLKVHEAALARGVKITGATVHFVDKGTDTGPILLQKAVEVQEGDTPQVLQRRVMEQAEWIILPQAIDQIAAGKCPLYRG